MRKTVNEVKIIGRLYSAELKEATVQNTASSVYGKEYINGTINIATDENCINIVPITYTFVTPTTKNGKPNPTYNNLKKIMSDESVKTVSKDGKEAAAIVEASKAAIAIDDRYVVAEQTYKTYMSSNGGFVSFKNKSDLPAQERDRNIFDTDIVITTFSRVPEDSEKGTPEYGIIHGAIFNFNGSILPADFKVTDSGGIDYFEGLGASNSNPVFTKIHGMVINNRQVTQKEEKTAFGAPIITTTYKTTRDWIVTSVIETPYDFGSEEVLTTEELSKKMQDREIHLAKVKKDAEDYAEKSKDKTTTGPVAPPVGSGFVPAGGFKF